MKWLIRHHSCTFHFWNAFERLMLGQFIKFETILWRKMDRVRNWCSNPAFLSFDEIPSNLLIVYFCFLSRLPYIHQVSVDEGDVNLLLFPLVRSHNHIPIWFMLPRAVIPGEISWVQHSTIFLWITVIFRPTIFRRLNSAPFLYFSLAAENISKRVLQIVTEFPPCFRGSRMCEGIGLSRPSGGLMNTL